MPNTSEPPKCQPRRWASGATSWQSRGLSRAHCSGISAAKSSPTTDRNTLFWTNRVSPARKQMNEFLQRLHGQDRVLLVGDTRQHEAVEAGRPYHQLQEAGMQTARLDEIVRQKAPALKGSVEQLARSEVQEAISLSSALLRANQVISRSAAWFCTESTRSVPGWLSRKRSQPAAFPLVDNI
jgi:AAA domain-containing protein